ncbi:MAG TPA: hypothetical protein VFI95_20315 [Terriglobales bacterium]|nr:hypothetical protein [Terriglobales bacterium]
MTHFAPAIITCSPALVMLNAFDIASRIVALTFYSREIKSTHCKTGPAMCLESLAGQTATLTGVLNGNVLEIKSVTPGTNATKGHL